MKVLIDGGAHTGDSLPQLLRTFGPFDRVVCFEANPALSIVKPADLDAAFDVERAALWKEDARLQFFFGEHTEQSSVMKNKTTGRLDRRRSTIVDAVDFPRWIAQHTGTDDRLTVKLDIEGAEFEVLEALGQHQLGRARIERLLVEWHHNRLRPRWRYRLRRRILELRYRLRGLPIQAWSTT